MKILLVVPEYPPYHIGGGGEVFKNLAENYRRLGHEVTVIYGYYPTKTWSDEIIEYQDKNGIKFIQIPEIPYLKSMLFLKTAMPLNFRSLLKIKNIIEKENPDFAHLHGYGLIFINIVAMTLQKLNIKYIFTIHGYPEKPNKSNIFIRLIWNIYVKVIMNRTLKGAKKITCVSNYVKEDKRNIFPEKSVVIFNGLNFSDFNESKEDINIRKKHDISEKTKIIFSLGRITEMKGFQNVIKLIPRLLEQGVDIRYLIAGNDDGYKNTLDALIKKVGVENSVIFVGFLDLEEKKQYLKQCDIFAVPSLWEPFGLVGLEGMVYNKIILTSNTGGLKEVFRDYKNIITIEDADIIGKFITYKAKPANQDLFRRFDYSLITKLYLDVLK